MIKLFDSSKKIIISVFIALSLVLVAIISIIAITFSNIYTGQQQTTTPVRSLEFQQKEFEVKKITIKDIDKNCYVEILSNGSSTQYCGSDPIPIIQKIISTEKISKLFLSISEDDFNSLLSDYFSSDRNLQIIIETSQGTKTISINSNSNNSSTPIIDDLIEDLEEIEDEVVQPTPSPPPTLPPTPTPSPGSTPTPTPTPSPGTSPTPSPTPITYEPGNPFDCSTISQSNVTVTNTRCLDQ